MVCCLEARSTVNQLDLQMREQVRRVCVRHYLVKLSHTFSQSREMPGPEGADHWFWRHHEAGPEPVILFGAARAPESHGHPKPGHGRY